MNELHEAVRRLKLVAAFLSIGLSLLILIFIFIRGPRAVGIQELAVIATFGAVLYAILRGVIWIIEGFIVGKKH